MIDSKKFKYILLKRGVHAKALAELLNISENTLSRKINNKNEFKASEIRKVTETLNLSGEEQTSIFFANDVDYKST